MKDWQETDFEPEAKEDNKGLIELLRKVLTNWYWFVICAILGISIAYLNLRYSTPEYKINAKVLITDQQKGATGASPAEFMGDFTSLFGGVNSVDNEAEILKTRYLMEQVIQKLNAQVAYFIPGNIRDVEIQKVPFHINILNTDSLTGRSYQLTLKDSLSCLITAENFEQEVFFDHPTTLPGLGTLLFTKNPEVSFTEKTYKFEIAPFDSRVSQYMGRLAVGVTNKQVSIIDLSFDHPLRTKGEDILRTVIETYTENNLKDKNTIADSTISFIENRLRLVTEELGDVEDTIQTFRQSQQLADITAQSQLLLENTSESFNELANVETQLTILSSLREYLQDENNRRVLPSAILPGDVVFSTLIERYNSLLLERDRQLLSATPDNPTVQNLDGQLSNLRADILENVNGTQRTLEITRNRLRQKTDAFESQVRTVPATERQYLALARQQQIKQELYVYLLQKREETAISKTANIPSIRVIDPPKADVLPFSPRRARTLFAGLLIGLIIPAAIIYLRSQLNTRIRRKEDISRYTQVPVIGEISHNTKKETLVVSPESRSAIAEQFRALRTNLSFYLPRSDQKTILLTSSMSGEGKSFVALNMAMIFAVSGKRVVLMEMDLRKPNISAKLDKPNEVGFTNFVIDSDLTPREILAPSGIHENLLLIGSGPIPPNPAETILSHRLDELMQHLNDRFDCIIIDAPPVGLVTDAQLLGKYADLSLYLVRQGYTYKNQLQIVEDLHRTQKMKQLAILVNDIDPKSGYGYGYGQGYGYGYYDNGHSDKPWWKFWAKS
ncbi:GumC family protein [Parapedobacter sp. DT-150]|uniref:GumC family protein n=1 Tax=Parapedobacter sp. DT-150 TaxID=3396162 RepID=UPI003F1D08E8